MTKPRYRGGLTVDQRCFQAPPLSRQREYAIRNPLMHNGLPLLQLRLLGIKNFIQAQACGFVGDGIH